MSRRVRIETSADCTDIRLQSRLVLVFLLSLVFSSIISTRRNRVTTLAGTTILRTLHISKHVDYSQNSVQPRFRLRRVSSSASIYVRAPRQLDYTSKFSLVNVLYVGHRVTKEQGSVSWNASSTSQLVALSTLIAAEITALSKFGSMCDLRKAPLT